MLTADENIVVVDLVVQYRRADPVKYLFNVRDPEATLQDVSESAIREVIGKNKLDFVLLEGRTEIAVLTEKLIQQTLDEYQTGMLVTKVNLQDANFPSQVEAAVQDAIKAREDRERLSFEAQAYANDVLPRARGEAVRRQQDSEAYRARVVADAQGEASRFTQLLSRVPAGAGGYTQAPLPRCHGRHLRQLEQGADRCQRGQQDDLPARRQDSWSSAASRPPPAAGQAARTPAASAAAEASTATRDREDRRTREAR